MAPQLIEHLRVVEAPSFTVGIELVFVHFPIMHPRCDIYP